MIGPVLRTARLTLRPFAPDDAPAIQRLAGAYEVALNTARIPHPYPEGAAAEWITFATESDKELIYAIDDGEFVGTIGLMYADDTMAELGYWIGVPYWGRGYATEAAEALIAHGFETLNLQRIFADYLARNPQSGRVLAKLGMRHEGTRRRHFLKWGERLDIELYAVLREEWLSARGTAGRREG